MEELFIAWLTGPLQESLYTQFHDNSYNKFKLLYPQYSSFKPHEIDIEIIDKVLPHINVNNFYKSKRIYQWFIETLINGSRYTHNLFNEPINNSFYCHMIEYFFLNIINKEDLLPLLIDNEMKRDYLNNCEDIYYTLQTNGLLIRFFISIYPDFERMVKEYIDDYDNIIPEYWENFFFNYDNEDRTELERENGYLKYLKYVIINGYHM